MKYIKYILLSIGVVTLLTTTGCIFPSHGGGGDYHGHTEYREYHGQPQYREYYGHPEYRSYPEPGLNVHVHAE